MARYDLPQYQSVYRDPQSVKINTILRQRYVENFAGADALQQSVDQMTSADFEGDKLEKENLVNQYNTELEEMSRQGDYERMGSRVASNARNFIQDYTPIQQNKARYDAYLEELDRLRKEGIDGGGISEFVYRRNQVKAKHGYYGLQRDEEGNIDEGSYFSAPGVVKSVDYVKVLDEALSGIKADAASTVFDIPQEQLKVDPRTGEINLQVMREKGVMRYVVETTSGWKQVSADRVKRIVDGVLDDPSVQMSLEQDADLSTFDINPNDAKVAVDNEIAEIDKKINGIADGTGTFWDENSRSMRSYSELKEKDRAKALENMQEYKDLVLDKRAEEGDISLLRSLERNNIMNRAMEASQAKYVYLETEEKKLLDYDDIHKHNLTNQTNQYTPTSDIYAPMGEKSSMGGVTYEDKEEYINTTQTVIDDSYSSLFNKQNTDLQSFSKEQIKEQINNIQNAEEFEELAKNYNMTPENFRNEVNQILENESRVNLVKQKIEETKDNLFGETYNADISKEYEDKQMSGYKGSDEEVTLSYKKIRDTLISMGEIDEGSSIKDALDYLNRQPQKSIPGTAIYGGGANYPAIADDILQYLADNEGLEIKPRKEESTTGGTVEANQQLFRALMKNYNERMEEDNEKVNAEFAKRIKTDAVILKNFGSEKEEGGRANTKAVRDTFKTLFYDKTLNKTGFPPHITIRTPEGDYEGTWQEYMDKQTIWGDADYEIEIDGIGMSSVPTPDGKHMLYVPIKFISGKNEGKRTYLLVDSSQVVSPHLDDWTNSAEYQVQQLYNRGIWENVKEYKPEMFPNVRFDYANDKVWIDIKDDNLPEIEMTKDAGLAKLAEIYAGRGYAKLFDEIKYGK